jgi:hypothetical protein
MRYAGPSAAEPDTQYCEAVSIEYDESWASDAESEVCETWITLASLMAGHFEIFSQCKKD